MANPEHLVIAASGSKAINDWVEKNPSVFLDLKGAVLSRRNIRIANFSGANLEDSTLFCSDIDFSKFINSNLKNCDLSCVSSIRGNFTGAILDKASLAYGIFVSSIFRDASLKETKLSTANMISSDLSNATIVKSDASFVNFTLANLTNADLTESNLMASIFNGTSLDQTNFDGATLHLTIFSNCNFSSCKGIDKVKHAASSCVDYSSISLTFHSTGNRLTTEFSQFLLKTGLPKEYIDSLPKIISSIKYFSCFISYGEPDKQFAVKLRDALIAIGINCWIYALDSKPGEETWKEITTKRRESQKMIVVFHQKFDT